MDGGHHRVRVKPPLAGKGTFGTSVGEPHGRCGGQGYQTNSGGSVSSRMMLGAQASRLLGIWAGRMPVLPSSRSFEIQPLPSLVAGLLVIGWLLNAAQFAQSARLLRFLQRTLLAIF